MAEVLQQQYRRDLDRARRGGSEEENQDDDIVGGEDVVAGDQAAQDEQRRRRILERFRQTDVDEKFIQDRVKQQLQEEVEKKVREFAARNTWRVFNIACSATIVLIIVTYIVWTIQLIVGNLLKSPVVPKLSLTEQVLWGVTTFLLFSIVAAGITLIIVCVRLVSGDIKLLGQLIWEAFTSILHLK